MNENVSLPDHVVAAVGCRFSLWIVGRYGARLPLLPPHPLALPRMRDAVGMANDVWSQKMLEVFDVGARIRTHDWSDEYVVVHSKRPHEWKIRIDFRTPHPLTIERALGMGSWHPDHDTADSAGWSHLQGLGTPLEELRFGG